MGRSNLIQENNAQALLGDKAILAVIVVRALTAVALGFQFVDSGLAWTVSAVLLALAGLPLPCPLTA